MNLMNSSVLLILCLSTEQDKELMRSVKWGSLLCTPEVFANKRSPIPNQGRNIKYPLK